MDHLALEHPRFSPTNRSSDALDRETALSAAALLLAATPAPGPPAWETAEGEPLTGLRSRSKQDHMNARLAAGENPWDMISLKAAIQNARPGSLSHRLYAMTLQRIACQHGHVTMPTRGLRR